MFTHQGYTQQPAATLSGLEPVEYSDDELQLAQQQLALLRHQLTRLEVALAGTRNTKAFLALYGAKAAATALAETLGAKPATPHRTSGRSYDER